MDLPGAAEKEANVVQFYNPDGEHLRTLKVGEYTITLNMNNTTNISKFIRKAVWFSSSKATFKK